MADVQVWAMRMNPIGGEGSFEYCKGKEIIGFGWGSTLPHEPNDYTDFEECKRLYKESDADKAINTVLNAVDKMLNNNKNGIMNLVWTIDDNGTYYLCIVNGGYEYIPDNKTGVCNSVHCSKYYKVTDKSIFPIDTDGQSDIIRSMKLQGTIHEIGRNESKDFSSWLAGFIIDNEDGLKR